MASIPQLRKDLNDTQRKLHNAEAEIKRLRTVPTKEIVREVKVPVQVVKVVERVSEKPPIVVEKRVEVPVDRIVVKEVIKEVPKQVIKTVTIEKDSAETVAKLKDALTEIKRLKAELDSAKSKVTICEKVVEVPVVEYRDNPEHIKMIRKLRGGK